MRKNPKQSLLILITVVASAISVQAKSDKAAVHVPDMVWANGDIYSMVLIFKGFRAQLLELHRTASIIFGMEWPISFGMSIFSWIIRPRILIPLKIG